jgi:hypothetical protein
MQRLKRIGKLLLIALAGNSVIVSCANIPKEPEINFYHMDFPRAQLLCSNSFGKKCDKILISQSDRFYMFSPQDWRKIQDYIDLLRCTISGGCKPMTTDSSNYSSMSTTLAFDVAKKRLNDIDNSLKSQRKLAEQKK